MPGARTRTLARGVDDAGPTAARGHAAERLLARLTVGQARVAAILAGGAIGTLCRAGLAEAVPHGSGQWPWATFVVNLAGAFILGWLLTRLAERAAPTRHWRFLAGTGIRGVLTTFSTFQLETFQFVREDEPALAIAYPLASIGAGMVLAVAG